MAGLETIAMVATMAATAASVAGSIQAGNAADEEAKFEAQQLKRRATEERAAGQRQASETRKQEEQVQSRIIARSAASGGGTTTDPTILDLIEDTAQRGEFLAQTETSLAENRARGYIDQGKAARARGKNKRAASIIDAVGEGAKGIARFGKAYG